MSKDIHTSEIGFIFFSFLYIHAEYVNTAVTHTEAEGKVTDGT